MPGLLKTQYATKSPKLAAVATGLEAHARWLDGFRAVPPLVLTPTANGSAALSLRDGRSHGFRLEVTAEAGGTIRWRMAGGTVYGPDYRDSVAGAGETLGTTRKWWLRDTCYNDGTAAETLLEWGTVFPESDYQVDVLPAETPCETPVLEGFSTVIVPLAEVDLVAGTTLQYQCGDVWLPRGPTITATRQVATIWDGGTVKAVLTTETMVRGQVTAVSGPVCVTLFATGPCPEPAP